MENSRIGVRVVLCPFLAGRGFFMSCPSIGLYLLDEQYSWADKKAQAEEI